MKKVTVSIEFICSDEIAKKADLLLAKPELPSVYLMNYFKLKSEPGSLSTKIATNELFYVQTQINKKDFSRAYVLGERTPEGYLALSGNPNLYPRGEAIKKAKMFDGKLIKAE